MDAASSRRAFANPYMTQSESPLFEDALPGAFVPNATISAIDTCMSMLFVTVESVRRYLSETDDGSLEWQLLRRALHEGYFNALRTLDGAGLLDESSQYPADMREGMRAATIKAASVMPMRGGNAQDQRAGEVATVLERITQIGRALLRHYQLSRELKENQEQHEELLRLSRGSGAGNGGPES